MKTLNERIETLLQQREQLERWVGAYDEKTLRECLDRELGDHRRFEEWVDGCKVTPRSPVLHILSGNTAHAAFQSVFRAYLVGCESWVKIPSQGLPEFEAWAEKLDHVEVKRELPEAWRSPEVAVVFGNEETLHFFHQWLSMDTRIIPHGPKLSAAFIFEEREALYKDLAEDILRHGQRGCLSVRALYVSGDREKFCEHLAQALSSYRDESHSQKKDLSEAGAVRNAREIYRFQIANGWKASLWESQGNTAWTILNIEESTLLHPGPGGGFTTVMPMPDEISLETLGSEIRHLSSAIVEPIGEKDRLEMISPSRICAAGKGQEPGVFWHPDGEMGFAGLVRWRDLG